MHNSRLSITSAILLAASATAQNWANLTPASGPSARNNPAIAFDQTRGNTVLFGGFDTISQADTWTWNGTAWAQRTPATSPTGRDYHAMCFDLSRGRLVLFGGWNTAGVPQNDTWEWDGTTWLQIVTTAAPSARYGTRMSYDLVRSVIVLHGGFDNVTTFGDTWEYQGTNWTQVVTTGSPPPRDSHGQVFDVAGNRTLIYGGWDMNGNPLNDTWALSGGNWTNLNPATAPGARTFVQMAYDLGRGVTVLFGGTNLGPGPNNFGDTWEFSATNWAQASPANVPGPRDSHAMSFDVNRGRVVMFGGLDGVLINTNQVWEFGGTSNAATYSSFGSGCQGSAGVPALAPVGSSLPRLNTTLQLRVSNLPAASAIYMVFGFSNTVGPFGPLPTSLAPFGMPGCTSYISIDSGTVIIGSGGAATWSLSVPNNQSFIGLPFFNQAVSLDPAAGNPAGATVSNAGQGRVGT